MVELLIYFGLFLIIVSVAIAFIFWLINSDAKAKNDREVLNSANRIMGMIISETRNADKIYIATTSASQLSLKTSRYLGANEIYSYIDFYLCGTNICFKREFSNPIILNSEQDEVSALSFETVSSGGIPSVRINLSISRKNSTISLTSVAFPRKP